MFSLIKHLLWIIHIAAIAYFITKYFGYDINWHYFSEQRSVCEERLAQCQHDLIKTGVDGIKQSCDWKCADVNPTLFLRKTHE